MEGLEVKVEKLSDDEGETVNNEEQLFLEAPIKIEYPTQPFEFKSLTNLDDFESCFPIKQEKSEDDERLNEKTQLLDAPSTSTHLLGLQPENPTHGDIPALGENFEHQANRRPSMAGKRPKKASKEVPCEASDLELDVTTGTRPLAPNKLNKIMSGTRCGRKTKKSAHSDAQNNLDWQLIEDAKKKTDFAFGGFEQNTSAADDKFSDGESGDDEFEVEDEIPLASDQNKTVLECLKTCPCQVCQALNNFDTDVIKTFLRTILGIFLGDAPQCSKQYLHLKPIPNKVSRVELTKNSGVYIPVAVKNQIKLDFHEQPSRMAMETLFALYGDKVFRTQQVTARGNKCGTYGIESHVLAAVLGFVNRNVSSYMRMTELVKVINKRANDRARRIERLTSSSKSRRRTLATVISDERSSPVKCADYSDAPEDQPPSKSQRKKQKVNKQSRRVESIEQAQ